jgi:hypothetical protein
MQGVGGRQATKGADIGRSHVFVPLKGLRRDLLSSLGSTGPGHVARLESVPSGVLRCERMQADGPTTQWLQFVTSVVDENSAALCRKQWRCRGG